MLYKVGDGLYTADGRQVNPVLMSGGCLWLEPKPGRLEELPPDAVAVTTAELMAQLTGADVPEEKPKKARKRTQ